MKKERLDQLLVQKGMVASREKGRALIMAGEVFVNGCKAEKAGTLVECDDRIEIRGNLLPYVSRGGLKLAKAIETFHIDLTGKIMMDVGASTGGFTDCALQHGARQVFAVDVGYGQLAWSLRQDKRVVVFERTNARYLTKEQINVLVDLITIDVSFISLRKILVPLVSFLKEGGSIVALIKPQFEAGKELVGKKGVVKDPLVHQRVIEDIIVFSKEIPLLVQGLTFSPIRGPEGNIEFLIWWQKNHAGVNDESPIDRQTGPDEQQDVTVMTFSPSVPEVVRKAHLAFANPDQDGGGRLD
ncbi:MAG: TlyA family RNA methyltransferase [Peptococcia bacterium]